MPTVFDYGRAEEVAQRLITKFGQTGAIRRTTGTSDPNNTPWDPSDDVATTTDYACTLAVLGYATREIDGSLIQANDRRVYVSTEGLTVSPGTLDRVVIGTAEYQIINVMPLNPAGTVVYYEIQARG